MNSTLTASRSATHLPPNLQLSAVAALLILLSLAATLFTGGCATQDVPGRVLATSVQTVDSAMQSWATYVALGHATAAQEARVRNQYELYQASQATAELAYVAQAKLGDVDAWTKARTALAASQGALLALLLEFNPPRK